MILWLQGLHLKRSQEISNYRIIIYRSRQDQAFPLLPLDAVLTTSRGTKPQTLLPLLLICSLFPEVPGLPFISCLLGFGAQPWVTCR